MEPIDSTARLRRQAYVLLIVVAMAIAAGRVLAAERVYEPSQTRDPGETVPRSLWPTTRPRPMPTFSSNDRSRWATVRALVDDGTYVIGRRDPDTKQDFGIAFEDGWQTIDMVLLPDRHEYYSSKPPLLATMVAGEYWVLQRLTGWTLKDNPQEVVRTILFTLNVLPLGLYLGLLALLVERYGTSDWGRLFVMTCAAFGTLVTPFLVTFNNHTIATFSVVVALAAALHKGKAQWSWFALSGLAAGFTATNELPALSFTAALGLVLLLRSPVRALLAYAPAAALPLAALLATNYLALGRLQPAYGEFGGPLYQYEGSHWAIAPGEIRRGIDWAWQHESHGTYVFHLVFGHHGIFSLTPIFLLTIPGLIMGLVGKRRENRSETITTPSHPNAPLPRSVLIITAAVSLCVIGFYLFVVDFRTHNYGGWTTGPRWLMWLTPLWLLTMICAVDWLARSRAGRITGLLLLALSILAMSFPAWNPWRHPYIYRWMDAQGLIPY